MGSVGSNPTRSAIIGVVMLGKHVIIDIYDAPQRALLEETHFETLLTKAVLDAGAKILTKCFHSFGEDSGFTGVICLMESHVSIHTWPEHKYAAVDVFMCGNANPEIVSSAIQKAMPTARFEIQTIPRG